MLIRDTKNEKIDFMIMMNYDESIQVLNMYYFQLSHSQEYSMKSHQKFIKNSNNFEIVIFINTYPNDSMMMKYVKISK